jgi:hypothetical protein
MRKEDWIPIDQLEDKYEDGLLFAAPELVHGDWNTRGVSRGFWDDGDMTFVGTGWCGCQDEPTRIKITPTHFMRIVSPYTKEELETHEAATYERERL